MDNSFSLIYYSDPFELSAKLFPMPKNIHDYIDDIQEITNLEVPVAYYNPLTEDFS